MDLYFGRAPATVRAIACFFIVLSLVALRPAGAAATTTVTGLVATADGTPVAGARVTLTASQRSVTGVSGPNGRFEVRGVTAGTNGVTVAAKGYASISERTVDVAEGGVTTLALVLERTTTNSLTVIGEVRSTGGATLSTSSAPSVAVSAQAAAAAGETTVAQMLWSLPSITPVLPLGGGGNAPVSFALRGPDPTETLVDIDGHQVNNGATGDFDLSLLDPADLQSVQVVYGISPSSLIGPNTLGGALNIVTLEPTTTPHALFRAFGGSYDSFGETLQTTGTTARIGYAVSAHRATSAGQIDQTVTVPCSDNPVPCTSQAGSVFDGTSLLTKLRYQLGDNGGFLQLAFRDQTVYKDLGALLTTYPAPPGGGGDATPAEIPQPAFAGFPGTTLQAHNAGYGFDAQLPLGPDDASGIAKTTLQFSHLMSLAAQSIDGPGADTSPYLYNDRDVIGDDWIQIDHRLHSGTLSLKADLMTETLRTDFVAGKTTDNVVVALAVRAFDAGAMPAPAIALAQTQRSVVLRYAGDPSSTFHYSLATYFSSFSTFGSSFDPRAGVVWTPTASTALRASVGTTFQSPQLPSLLVPSPTPQPSNGLVSIGNPNLQPDHATEYDLGWDQLFGAPSRQTHLTVDLYRTNLRTPITQYVPANYDHNCQKHCLTTYPINFGGQVYAGIDVKAERRIANDFKISASWDVDSSYLTQTLPGSTLLGSEQTLGQPLHKASLGFARDVPAGLVYSADVDYVGTYNQLNQPPFATVDASVAYRWRGFEVGLYGTNLTNVYNNRFTALGVGVPYGAAGGVPAATDAYVLQGAKVVMVLTSRL